MRVYTEAIKKDGDEMMILKKKEVIAASLVVLIGLAGYLNWSYQDTVRVKDNDSYVQTGKMLGEAEMVSSNNETEEDEDGEEAEKEAEKDTEGDAASMENTAYFADAKSNRETARAAAMEALKAASKDESVDEATRKLAGEKLVQCAQNIELESNVENVAAAKGFADICVYINEGTAIVTVKSEGLTDDEVVKLTDVVTSTAGINSSNIKIIPVG